VVRFWLDSKNDLPSHQKGSVGILFHSFCRYLDAFCISDLIHAPDVIFIMMRYLRICCMDFDAGAGVINSMFFFLPDWLVTGDGNVRAFLSFHACSIHN
jgi:hypothetical protein